jgi:hypothetical protein
MLEQARTRGTAAAAPCLSLRAEEAFLFSLPQKDGDMGNEELDLHAEEERQVSLWRLAQFCELGFDYAHAVVLADAPVDLGEARRLLASGCPAETASRILL